MGCINNYKTPAIMAIITLCQVMWAPGKCTEMTVGIKWKESDEVFLFLFIENNIKNTFVSNPNCPKINQH